MEATLAKPTPKTEPKANPARLVETVPGPAGALRRIHRLWDGGPFRINWHLDGKVVDSAFVTVLHDGMDIKRG